tara:strand:- start:92 stop:211 length:120 start_codon:yes stop_codon:yes gene_type:complete
MKKINVKTAALVRTRVRFVKMNHYSSIPIATHPVVVTMD